MAKKNTPVALSPEQIVEIVDKLGQLQAQIAPLEKLLEGGKATLKGQGVARYEGVLFEANVFDTEYEYTDWPAIREKISHQLLSAHTETRTKRTCKITGRKVATAAIAA